MLGTAVDGGAASPVAKAALGSSFFWAMRLLPPARRDGMFAVYAFRREVAEGDTRHMQDRITTLERDLAEERRRNKDLRAADDRVRDTVEERVHDREEVRPARRTWNPFGRGR